MQSIALVMEATLAIGGMLMAGLFAGFVIWCLREYQYRKSVRGL